eukprot:scaffold10157_cov44-Phaeocystis_antarctica.AAC.2
MEVATKHATSFLLGQFTVCVSLVPASPHRVYWFEVPYLQIVCCYRRKHVLELVDLDLLSIPSAGQVGHRCRVLHHRHWHCCGASVDGLGVEH